MAEFRVRYHIATYSGVVRVHFSDDEDPEREMIIGRAQGQLRRQVGFFPFGSQSWRVLKDGEPDLEDDDA